MNVSPKVKKQIIEYNKEYFKSLNNPIFFFDGDYSFLSNFHDCNVGFMFQHGDEVNSYIFSSTESAFQAMKCPSRAEEFIYLNPSEAKKLGRKVPLRPDWESYKLQAMKMCLVSKFAYNKELADKLLATGDRDLVEGNYWNDEFWGVSWKGGENHLGKLLMEVREGIRKSREKNEQ